MRPLSTYVTEDRKVVSFASLGITFALFLFFIVPPMTRMHHLHRECIVIEGTIVPRYCCTQSCSVCNESPRDRQLCSSIISRTHLEKNVSQCLLGERKFCADEGSLCHVGSHCCEESSVWIGPGPADFMWTCDREVKRRSCRLHCPTCWKSKITYVYQKDCSDGACRNITYIKEHDCSLDKLEAERDVISEPLQSRRDCWVDPSDSQNVHFSKYTMWWRILLTLMAAIPATFVSCIILFEMIVDVVSDINTTDNPWTSWDTLLSRDDPPPRYSE